MPLNPIRDVATLHACERAHDYLRSAISDIDQQLGADQEEDCGLSADSVTRGEA